MIAAASNPDDDGERRKVRAFALLTARREALIRRGQRALLAVLLQRGEATCDDVRAAVPLPPDINPKCFGPVPSDLAKAGIIAAVGFTKSVRPEAHARPVRIWRLADRAAAEYWLLHHPELPDPDPQDGSDADLFDSEPQ